MPTIGWIVLVVAAVIVVGAVAWWAGQRRRSQRLQDRFGPEYERTVQQAGDRSRAERDLEARQERVESLEIRPLDPADRERFRHRWQVTQALFVDDPASAVGQADDLIGEVMRARGYPVGDFEQRAADVSVNHPQVVDHYRTAHAIALRQWRGEADTEGLRQAMVHYRALFSDLLETDDESDDGGTRGDAEARADAGTAGDAARPAEATPPPDVTAPVGTDRRSEP